MNFQEFDSIYLQRLRDGDADTEKHFVAYFAPLLLIKLRPRVRSASLIEDIRQETFLRTIRIIRSPEGVRQADRLGAFVNTVCHHVLMEHLRADARHQPVNESTPEPVDPVVDPERSVITRERKKIVRSIVESLPDRERRLLRSVFFEERDKEEVCQEFGVDRNYLRVLLHRAKIQFRERYLQSGAADNPPASPGREKDRS